VAGFPVASPGKDLERWWVAFDDARMSGLIREAVAGNPEVGAAVARVRQAQAQRQAQAADLFPGVTASAVRGFRSDEVAAGRRSSETSYSLGLNASWEPDFFGRTSEALKASTANAAAAQENLGSAQASLAAEVALAYIDLRAAEARLKVVRESLVTREESRQLAAWRNQAGQSDVLEVRQAESSLEQARASLSSLEQSAGQTRNRLARLCGKAPGALDATLQPGTGRLPSPAGRLSIGIPADTVRQRPDVRAAGYQWVASIARTRAAEAERLPSLRLSGSVGTDSLKASKLFNVQDAGLGLIAGLTAPVFDGGRIRANIAAEDAASEAALRSYEGAVLTALSEVEDALIACKRSTERAATLEVAAAAAAEALTLATQRYNAGVVDFLTLLEAQRTDLGLQESVINARADRSAAFVELYKALGGGWSR
jgi:NodT family efflux transporter outer membrane factor (OMF) lipoprotein